jgi:hypothetical protein
MCEKVAVPSVELPREPPHIVTVPKRPLVRGSKLLDRLKPRFRRRGSPGRPRPEEGEPVAVEPDRPKPLMGGAAAPVEEEV